MNLRCFTTNNKRYSHFFWWQNSTWRPLSSKNCRGYLFNCLLYKWAMRLLPRITIYAFNKILKIPNCLIKILNPHFWIICHSLFFIWDFIMIHLTSSLLLRYFRQLHFNLLQKVISISIPHLWLHLRNHSLTCINICHVFRMNLL